MSPIRLAIFNHKGGVGKTTLTFNIGASLASTGLRVLLVDSDPQCNLTSYLVAPEVVDDLLDESDSASGSTIWSSLKPVSEATGMVRSIRPIEPGVDNLFLIPGDIRLTEFESDLNEYWAQCFQRKSRGFRGMGAISELVSQVSSANSIDIVLFDSGPNIGPLNRAIILDCDYLIVPVACDLFSLRALKTLGRTLVDWIWNWSTIADLAPTDLPLLGGHPAFLGYIPEGFRVYGGELVQNHAKYLAMIERAVDDQIVSLLEKLDESLVHRDSRGWKLGEVKNFGSLVPASQHEGTPISEVRAGTQWQRDEARDAFIQISREIIRRAAPNPGR